MVYNRLPAASGSKPNLNPSAPVQPLLYQPDAPSSRSGDVPTSFTARGYAGKGRGRVISGTKDSSKVGSSGNSSREAPQGNYKSYYLRRRAFPSASTAATPQSGAIDAPDPRLELIPQEWWKGKKVLDVGCNSGMVTIEVAQRLGAGKVVGVDVDKELVKSAKGNAELAWSRQAPLKRLLDEAAYLASRKRRAASPSSHTHSRSRSTSPPPAPSPIPTAHDLPSPFVPPSFSHFPLSLPRQYGFLPFPRVGAAGLLTRYVDVPEVETQGVLRKGKRKVMPREERGFPENLRFRQADWVEEEIQEDREGYDVIIAFSITKWIHLTSLNAGLLTFFRRCFSTLLPGGRLILEPQPFSSYARTLKNLRPAVPELNANLARLEEGAERGWRAEDGDFQRVLLESIGFEKRELRGYTGEEGSTWRRPVEVYTKRGGGSWGV